VRPLRFVAKTPPGELLRPGRWLLSRLRLVGKFAVVGLLLCIPVAWLTMGYVSTAESGIKFAQRERQGVMVMRAVQPLFLAEVTGIYPPGSTRQALSDELSRVLKRFDDPGLTASWKSFSDNRAGRNRALNVETLIDLIIKVGDQSNLTLDPKLDSFYLMDATQSRLPRLIATTRRLNSSSTVSSSNLWASQRELLRVTSDDLHSISSGLTTAADAGSSSLRAQLRQVSSDMAGRVTTIEQALVGPDSSTARANALFSVPSIELSNRWWTTLLQQLDLVLADRVDAQQLTIDRFLVVATLVVSIAGYLLLSLFSGLLRPLREMEHALERVGEGDLDVRVREGGTDELANVAAAINTTVAKVAAARVELEHRAWIDPITMLPNRHAFLRRLHDELAQQRPGELLALWFVDLDHFKVINDTYGHRGGDLVLAKLAERLRSRLPNGSFLARLSGDEFVAVWSNFADEHEPRRIADDLLNLVREPVDLSAIERGSATVDGACIGLAMHDGRTRVTEDDMLATADLAMFHAKKNGRAQVCEFSEAMRADAHLRLRLRGDLQKALLHPTAWGLSPAYQPIIDISTSRLIGVEALARWNHPELGFISPVQFIPVAEDSGAIMDLGRHMLNQACDDVRRWAVLEPQLHVSVNVSAQQLGGGELINHVGGALDRAGLDPHSLWLEITESMVMSNVDDSITTIGRLRDLGVALSIDDFGTGYSSLAYLQKLEATALKIDRSFVTPLSNPDATRDVNIVRAMVDLAHHLDLIVIAEGIEDITQLDTLRSIGCDCAQGFLIARPMAAGALGSQIEARGDSGLWTHATVLT
jgi:diguanylate cyclase (GGDEF)-like protein